MHHVNLEPRFPRQKLSQPEIIIMAAMAARMLRKGKGYLPRPSL